ncbi:helix-turn-helix domain-containing protein [Thermus sp. SYSU G05001]|uniref:Helix-turn-helix domain-containing protein n=1 Tax=Thermus brevis TaxID=2862456 RepID=A0ABS7A0H4_9DEIN|nr:helix-turn-helix transcriptional regulator [Thermus brevis]MBW6395806.1 helix-turn-helix domain-containing protein [Thermus brevis]
MTEIGKRVRELRERAGLSQHELAKRAGLTQGMIWQIEEGRKRPSVASLLAIARALNVSPSELLPVVNTKENPDA